MTFRTFMERALYDPEFGYYSRNIGTVGRRGDFSTSATLSPALGQTVARWALEELIRFPKPWHLIEVGAGDGSLAMAVLGEIGLLKRHQICYHIVESSEILIKQQKSVLGDAATWHHTISPAVAAAGHRAVVFSNELVDAFPATLLQWDADDRVWDEVYLLLDDTGAILEHPFTSGGHQPGADGFVDGQRIETHESYHEWLHTWVPDMRKLSLLTIDYGDTFPHLYHRRPTGTLRGYCSHQTITGTSLYQRIGQQDITADVNFTDLTNWGKMLEISPDLLVTQRDFILRYGASKAPSGDPAHTHLLDPVGAGDAFKVLVQRK